jgi:hypothetical protein
MMASGVESCREGVMEVPCLDVFETGNEPDYYITDILRIEATGEHDVRIYLASRRNSVMRLEFSAVLARSALRPMAQQVLDKVDEMEAADAAAAKIVRFPISPK